MAKVNQPSKQRLIDSALRLMRRQGYLGTGVTEIAQGGDAPIGSFYYYFPGGKEELAAAAMAAGAESYGRLISRALSGDGDFATRASRIALDTGKSLARNDFALGCPVATTALETVTSSPALQSQARRAFTHWTGLIRAAAVTEGVDHDRADELATNIVSILEGAELLTRVEGSPGPLEAAAAAIKRLCDIETGR